MKTRLMRVFGLLVTNILIRAESKAWSCSRGSNKSFMSFISSCASHSSGVSMIRIYTLLC